MSNLVGHSLGRYHILEQLGEGGMATVYKALDTRLERQVAIKVIRRGAVPPNLLATMFKRFEREAKSLARLSHPNIVKVLDYGEQDGLPYLVMEYVPGGTLKQHLAGRNGKPMPWQEAARWLAPIARSLEYAHQRNIVHRDVKPANILISETGRPMLSDFGIAKMLESMEETSLTDTGVGIGTPEYMAPEQTIGKAIDHRSDIYALCVVFYEMVTGRKPYQADSPMSVLLKHASEPLPQPRQFVPALPEVVENVLLKGLEKWPEDRYKNMGLLAKALEQIAQSEQPATNRLLKAGALLQGGRWLRPLAVTLITLAGIAGLMAVLNKAPFASTPEPRPTTPALLESIASPAALASDTPILLASPTTPPVYTATALLTPTPVGPAPGEERVNPRDNAAVIYIPPGPVTMGLRESQIEALSQMDPVCAADKFTASIPARQEQSSGYWIHKTEVTNLMYRRCVGSGACTPLTVVNTVKYKHYYTDIQYQGYPVVFVDWLAAQSYCVWAGGRLPTEQEWEKAARGTDGRLFPWGNEQPSPNLTNVARFVGDTMEVGMYPLGASPYGVLDMAGNVREWLQDSYSTGVTRGGAYGLEACFASSGYRNTWKQSQPDLKTGFRCAFDNLP